ncbi:hypothetical protein FI667_g11536, partial [Globisporangium splendens]
MLDGMANGTIGSYVEPTASTSIERSPVQTIRNSMQSWAMVVLVLTTMVLSVAQRSAASEEAVSFGELDAVSYTASGSNANSRSGVIGTSGSDIPAVIPFPRTPMPSTSSDASTAMGSTAVAMTGVVIAYLM